ncbi:hypothetical protein SDJN02_13149, partial [Cucurbita argyrosperma subsp. argyrosperma]
MAQAFPRLSIFFGFLLTLEIFRAMAAVSKTSFMALVAVLFTVVSVAVAQSAESPAPAPASPATSVVPSLSVACVGAFVALVFGSALKA